MWIPHHNVISLISKRPIQLEAVDVQKAVVAKSKVIEKAKAPKKTEETKTEFRRKMAL
jgi:hypothetical protein